MALTEFLSRLKGVKHLGDGQYQALCPAHNDSNPSLSISVKADGTVLLHCHAGCTPDAVVDALGMRFSDLGPDNAQPSHRVKWTQQDADVGLANRGLRPDTVRHFHITANLQKQAWSFPVTKGINKCKGFPSGPAAKFWWAKKGKKAPVYLPKDCRGTDVAYLVEGEPDVWIMWQAGLHALSFTYGASAIPKGAVEEVTRAKIEQIHIIYDLDEAGRNGAVKAAAALRDAGVSCSILQLPESVGQAGDITNLYGNVGHDDTQFREVIAKLPVSVAPSIRVRTIEMSTVKAEKVLWLWDGRIPHGKLTVLDGDPGLGKSTICYDIAARVSKGRPMPDESKGADCGVVFLTAEDGLGDTVRPRLEAAGANLKRIATIETVVEEGRERGITLTALGDLDRLREAIEAYSARFVFIDPFVAYLTSEVNTYRDQDVRVAMRPVATLAEETGAAIVLVRHLTKGSGGSTAVYRGGGSIGIIGAARAGLLVAKPPGEQTGLHRVLAVTKNNLAPPPPSMLYRIVPADNSSSRIEWLGESEYGADQLVALPADQQGRTAIDDAKDFLCQELANGPRSTMTIVKEAENAGISKRTLERARQEMGMKSRKSGFKSGWELTLPQEYAHRTPPTSSDEETRRPSGNGGGLREEKDSHYQDDERLGIQEY